MVPPESLLMPGLDLFVSPDKSRRLIDRSVGLFLFKVDLVVAESAESLLEDSLSLDEATDSLDDDRDLLHGF